MIVIMTTLMTCIVRTTRCNILLGNLLNAYNKGRMNDDYHVQLKEGMAEIPLMEAFQGYGYPYVCSMK